MSDISFGEWLKRRRKAAGLTQEQLAQQVSCSTITLRKIEAEERRPSEQIAGRLAEIFNVSQSEQTNFIRFARGDLRFTPTEIKEDTPWHISTKSPRSNLPATVTSLIGREQEIALVREYLLNPNIHLVTLIGPPGIGKTRLGLEAARAILPDFPDGVFFVALAPLDDPSLIVPIIIQSLGYVEAKDQSLIKRLMDGICDGQILLVLDNCEHLIEDIASLASGLLSACSRLKIIATSRESLRIPGEWVYAVPALGLPKDQLPADMDAAAQFPALTLFAERARTARPDFKLGADNLRAVISICTQLDGLPLAIELIAARIRLMSPQMLLERMTSQFVLSADGMRSVSDRQKTLNNAIGWSYNFLLPEEQKMFIGLSVFSGGFTLEAAEAVFSNVFTGKPVSDLVALLSDKSLLQRTLDARGEVRFNMLVTIQQFASDILHRTGDETQARDLHLAYFLSLAETGEREIRGPRQVEWADRIQDEQNNMRVALEWAVSSRKTEAALRLLSALGWPWEIRGHYSEAQNWLDRIRTLSDVNEYPSLLSRILSHIGRYHWTQERFQEAYLLFKESEAIAIQMRDQGERELANALNWFALHQIENDKDNARRVLEQSLELSTKHGDDWGIALSTFHLGILEGTLRHTDAALSLLEKSLAIFHRFGDLFFISRVSIFLGYLFMDRGQYDRARQLFEQHLHIDTQLHFWDGIASGWLNLGNLARQQGDNEQAKAYYEQARVVGREHSLAIRNLPEQIL